MPTTRFRLTVRRLMVVVAFAGLDLAAFRIQPALGSFVSGVTCLALIRTFGAIDRGAPMLPMGMVRTFCASTLIAATIIVVSAFPGFCLLPVHIGAQHPFPVLNVPTIVALVIEASLGIPIALALRRRLW